MEKIKLALTTSLGQVTIKSGTFPSGTELSIGPALLETADKPTAQKDACGNEKRRDTEIKSSMVDISFSKGQKKVPFKKPISLDLFPNKKNADYPSSKFVSRL